MKSSFFRSSQVLVWLTLVSLTACTQRVAKTPPPTPQPTTVPTSVPTAVPTVAPAAPVVSQQDLEIEFQDPELAFISTQGTTYDKEVVQYVDSAGLKHLPRGSALITDSGALSHKGIRTIIHAASGKSGGIGKKPSEAEKLLVPTSDGVRLAVENSLILANRFNHQSVAIPLIGGNIFLSIIGGTLDQLATTVIQAALAKRGSADLVFIDLDVGSFQAFLNAWAVIKPTLSASEASHVKIMHGNIVDFSKHGCDAIVNAANTEVSFGGGISGAIGKATQISAALNQFARVKITLFNAYLGGYFLNGMTTRPARSAHAPAVVDPWIADWTVEVPPPAPLPAGATSSTSTNSTSSTPQNTSNPGGIPASSGATPSPAPKTKAHLFDRELEFSNPLLKVFSTQGTVYSKDFAQSGRMPKGSAYYSQSGVLAQAGIRGLVFATLGDPNSSTEEFKQTVGGLEKAIGNAMILAKRNDHRRIAIPLIGGLTLSQTSGISVSVLAEKIIHAALNERGKLEVVLIDMDPNNFNAYSNAWAKIQTQKEFQAHVGSVQVIQGDILNFSTHQSDVIVMSSATSMQFDGGISNVIANATQQRLPLGQAASQSVALFNNELLKVLGKHDSSYSRRVGVAVQPDPYFTPYVAPVVPPAPQPTPSAPKAAPVAPPSSAKQPASGSSAASAASYPLAGKVAPFIDQPGAPRKFQAKHTNKPTNDTYTNCSSSYWGNFRSKDAVHAELLRIAQNYAAKNRMVWYRWGDAEYELDRVGMHPAFDIMTHMNKAAQRAGKGLYVATTPVASATYGDDTVLSSTSSSPKKPAIITITAPTGTPILDITNPKVVTDIHNSGYYGSLEQLMVDCNPPVAVKYDSHGWWALKDAKGVEISEFDGRFLTTQQIFDYHNNDLKPRLKETRKAYWNKALKKTLATRIFRPKQTEKVPVSYTALKPITEWAKDTILSAYDAAKLLLGLSEEYYWRYDGTCGKYRDAGNILEENNVDSSLCRNVFQTRFVMQGTKCYEMPVGEDRIKVGGELSPAQCQNQHFAQQPPKTVHVYHQYGYKKDSSGNWLNAYGSIIDPLVDPIDPIEWKFKPTDVAISAGSMDDGAGVFAYGSDTHSGSPTVYVLLGQEHNSGEWNIMKGKVDPGQTFVEAARRELEEESGGTYLTTRDPNNLYTAAVTEKDLLHGNYDVYISPKHNNLFFVAFQQVAFLPASKIKANANNHPDFHYREMSDYAWIPVDTLKQNLSIGQRTFTGTMPNGNSKTVTIFGHTFEALQQAQQKGILDNL